MHDTIRTTGQYAARIIATAVMIGATGLAAMSIESDPLAAGLSFFAFIGITGAVIGAVEGWWGQLGSAYAAWLVIAVLAAALQQVFQSVREGLSEGGTSASLIVTDVAEIVPFTAMLLYTGVAIGLLVARDLRRTRRRPDVPLPH